MHLSRLHKMFIARRAPLVASQPSSSDTAPATHPALATVRLVFAALLTALFAHAQLTAAPIWTLLTGEGAYEDFPSACGGLCIYGAGTLLACISSTGALQALRELRAFRWLTWGGVVLGFSIVYPAAFHFYYQMPGWLFSTATILTLLLGLLSLRWCQFLIPFSFMVTLSIGSFLNVPHYTWDITDLRHTLNVLAILNGMIVAVSMPSVLERFARRGMRVPPPWMKASCWQPDSLTLLVLVGFGCVIGYFYAGCGKIAISSNSIWMVDGVRWIWLERLDKFFQLFFHMGCTWLVPTFSPQGVYDFLGQTWVRCTACGIVLAGELMVVLFLLWRRFCITGLIACQLLHLGFALICGTYFSHWFVINTIFLLIFSRAACEQLQRQWNWLQRLGITAAAILLCPLIFHTSVLAWSTDRSQLEIFTWHSSPLPAVATAQDLGLVGEPQIDPNKLFPYEKSFQMSWRFARLIENLQPKPIDLSAGFGQNSHDLSTLERFGRWYKLRMVGEWHEYLPRNITPESFEGDLQRLLVKYHERRFEPTKHFLPVYYTHMAYNRQLIPNRAVQRRQPICSYVLIRQQLQAEHGCVYMAASPTTLCRIAVPPWTTAQSAKLESSELLTR